jgi:dipeptidyl aminopeptidase/acylaminoacyl peptidase
VTVPRSQVLQGGKDEVVPKGQAEELVKAITKADIEYVVYHDEQHGWRQEKNIKDALEQEITFYEKVLVLNGESL